MYYNQSSDNSWPNDPYHHYPQHQDNRSQNRQDFSGYRNQEEWARQSYNPFAENRQRVPQLHNRWEEEKFHHERYRPNHPENYPIRHNDNSRAQYNTYDRNRPQHFDRWNEHRFHQQDHYGPDYGTEGGNYEYDRYRQEPPQQSQRHHHHNSGALAASRVGGSFTSYSASRSRTGNIGYGRSGGALYREGPGMNSYSHGDINANSNW